MTRPHWLPERLWLGIKVGEWPVHTFVGEDAAARWASEPDDRRRRVWCVDIPADVTVYRGLTIPTSHQLEALVDA